MVEYLQQDLRDRRAASMRTCGRLLTRKELPRELSIACPRQNDHDRAVSGQCRHRSSGPRSYTCSLHLCGWHQASGYVLTPKHLNRVSQAGLCRILDRDDAPAGSLCGWRSIHSGRRRVLDQRKGCNADSSRKVDNLPDRRLNHTFRPASPMPPEGRERTFTTPAEGLSVTPSRP
jgi:hypothetical protein